MAKKIKTSVYPAGGGYVGPTKLKAGKGTSSSTGTKTKSSTTTKK